MISIWIIIIIVGINLIIPTICLYYFIKYCFFTNISTIVGPNNQTEKSYLLTYSI